MILDKLNSYQLVLGSASPRRQALLQAMNIPFKVDVRPINETYPANLKGKEITEFIAQQKAAAFKTLKPNTIVITSDTLVLINNKILGKPKDLAQAKEMLKQLSGKTHQVITSLCIKNNQKSITESSVTEVTFNPLSEEMISYYLENYKPLDKAGAYGIQDWIGLVGVTNIQGSYNTVVGLPTHLLNNLLNLML